jgi:hypothetical protein
MVHREERLKYMREYYLARRDGLPIVPAESRDEARARKARQHAVIAHILECAERFERLRRRQ